MVLSEVVAWTLHDGFRMQIVIRCVWEHAGYTPDVGNEEPGFGTCDSFLPVFCHSAASLKLCKGPFDLPSLGNDLEALRSVGTLDDL